MGPMENQTCSEARVRDLQFDLQNVMSLVRMELFIDKAQLNSCYEQNVELTEITHETCKNTCPAAPASISDLA